MPKKIFIISVILGIILTPCSFNFPKLNNLYDLTSSGVAFAAGAEAIDDSEVGYICASSALTKPKRDWRGYLVTQTLTVDKSPYYFTGAVSLARNNVLTIEPGVVIKVSDEYFYEWYMYPVVFHISGRIIAQGTETNPIVFTSIYDDSYCGDSNGDGAATAPEPGSWGGWQISSGDNIFDHVIMKYGGDYKRGLMVFYANTGNQITNSVFENNLRGIDFSVASSSNPAIIENNVFFNNTGGVIAFHNSTNPIIRYNNIYGNKGGIVVSDSATPLINYNNIYNNIGYGASVNQYYSLTQPVNAQFNWWGDDSGPYHPVLNPQGKGDRVSDKILFDPWIGKEKKKDPVIIVPGIMGSWNVSGKLELDPILHTYDNLWEALKAVGYEENKTLFAFPYQWRLSNVISAGYLKNKINEVKSICECEKVDIVAHSMGGFVARYYVESDDYENDIDQLVFLGTPHKGSPKSYLTWEAAEGFEHFKEKIAKKYFSIEAHLLGYNSLFEYIQNRVKSVEQLLPVYPYLQDIGSVKLREYNQNSYPNNYPYNSFLESLNSEENLNKFSGSGVKVFNITGNSGDDTVGVINVSSGEQYYPKWEHGYAEENIRIAGDNSVPRMSSSLFPTTVINNTNHNQIPTNAQKQIIEYLTGQMPVIEISDTPEPEEILAVAIYSPADFAIISPSGKRLGKDFLSDTNINQIDYAFYTGFEDEPEFAVIVNPEQGDYKVELRGTGNGEYKLDLSYIDEEREISREFTGNIQQSQAHNFDFTYEAEAEDLISELEPDDNIPPEITIHNPVENEQYFHSENLVIDYIASDDFSGVADTAIKLDNQILSTTTIDLFYYDLGEHVLNITAVDNAGNSASAEVKFKIIVDIDSAIQDIERIYDLGWISKKYVKQILITELEVLRKRLDIFAKQKDNIEKLKQKILNNSTIKERHKQKLLDEFNKRLQELEQQEDEFIEKSLSSLVKTLDKFLRKAVISQQGYDIIISDINYLRNNLK